MWFKFAIIVSTDSNIFKLRSIININTSEIRGLWYVTITNLMTLTLLTGVAMLCRPSSSSSSSAFNVRGPHITQAWDVRHPRWHGSDGCPQQHSVVSCTNSTTFNGSGYTRLCQGSSMNSWLTWGYWYMFLLLKELLQPDGLPAPTHPLGRGVFNETPSHRYSQIPKILNTVSLASVSHHRLSPAFERCRLSRGTGRRSRLSADIGREI